MVLYIGGFVVLSCHVFVFVRNNILKTRTKGPHVYNAHLRTKKLYHYNIMFVFSTLNTCKGFF